jgi:hypothetical protein
VIPLDLREVVFGEPVADGEVGILGQETEIRQSIDLGPFELAFVELGLVPQPFDEADEVLAAIVGDQALRALRLEKADVVEDVFEGFVGLAQCAERRVEDIALGNRGVVESLDKVKPPRAFRDKEAVIVIRILAVGLFSLLELHTLFDRAGDEFLAFGFVNIGTAFQEEQPEDVVLVSGGIEALLPQAVGGGIEVAFEFGEREAGHGSVGKGAFRGRRCRCLFPLRRSRSLRAG